MKLGIRREATDNKLRRAVIVGVLVGVSVFGGLRSPAFGQLVKSVDAVGMTVTDMDQSMDFFSKVLSFEKISDVEVHGAEYERLQGVFGLRMRVVGMKLGGETIELTQYLAPEGRPIPIDWRSHDHGFQHIAIVVSDMDKAYQQLRAHKVRHASTAPQTIPATNTSRGRHPRFLLQGSERSQSGDYLFSSRQGRSALAAESRQTLSRHRSHRDCRFEHAGQPKVLSGYPRA